MTVIYAILVFCLVIFVHELGHLLAAKAVGIRVNEFSIGMGPILLKKQGKETQYSLRALPLGGYNRMEGEDGESDDPRAFGNAPVLSRILVVVAGAVMNFLTCVLILVLIYGISGYTTNKIGAVMDGYPAAETDLQVGDAIVEVNGEATRTWPQVLLEMQKVTDSTVALTVRRGSETLHIVSGILVSESGQPMVGIQSQVSHNIFGAIWNGLRSTVDIGKEMIHVVAGLFRGQSDINDFMGPVGVVSVIAEEAKLGFLYVADLAAIISLNLGIMNLLPFPALDGGRLLFLLINVITGKPVKQSVEGAIHTAGLMLLLGFSLFLIVKDIRMLL